MYIYKCAISIVFHIFYTCIKFCFYLISLYSHTSVCLLLYFNVMWWTHCVKSIQTRSFFWSVFSPNGKIQTRENSLFGHFSRSDFDSRTLQILLQVTGNKHSWQRVPKPPILWKQSLFFITPLFFKFCQTPQPPPHCSFCCFVSLAGWVIAPHLTCYHCTKNEVFH